jgi:hypothetical protein
MCWRAKNTIYGRHREAGGSLSMVFSMSASRGLSRPRDPQNSELNLQPGTVSASGRGWIFEQDTGLGFGYRTAMSLVQILPWPSRILSFARELMVDVTRLESENATLTRKSLAQQALVLRFLVSNRFEILAQLSAKSEPGVLTTFAQDVLKFPWE